MSAASDRISVVIPMWNAQRTIRAAVESALGQSVRPHEVVVVDNGSEDGSVAAARAVSPSVRVLSEPKRGPAAARNTGLQAVTGEWVAFLDADDLMPADRLAVQSAALRDTPAADIAFGQQLFFADGDEPWQASPEAWPAAMIRPALAVGAMLCRGELFARVGPFDDRLMSGELLEWFARAQDAGVASVTPPQVVLFRRIHANNMTRDRRGLFAQNASAIKQILDRRRRQSSHAN